MRALNAPRKLQRAEDSSRVQTVPSGAQAPQVCLHTLNGVDEGDTNERPDRRGEREPEDAPGAVLRGEEEAVMGLLNFK